MALFRLAFLVVCFLAVGCQTPTHGNPTPGGATGGGGGGAGSGDGDGDGDPTSYTISGIICDIGDPHLPTTCTGGNLGNMDIRTSVSVTTGHAASDNTFSIATIGGTAANLLVGFNFAGYRHSLNRIALTDNEAANVKAPVMLTTTFNQLVTAAGGSQGDGLASVLVYIERTRDPMSGDPLTSPEMISGATVLPPAGVMQTVYYDVAAPGGWDASGQTGTHGAAAIFNVPADDGITDIQITNAATLSPFTVGLIPVAADALTFVIVDISPYELN